MNASPCPLLSNTQGVTGLARSSHDSVCLFFFFLLVCDERASSRGVDDGVHSSQAQTIARGMGRCGGRPF